MSDPEAGPAFNPGATSESESLAAAESAAVMDGVLDAAPAASAPHAVAPAWHTLVLVLGVAALTVQSASRFSGMQPVVNRLQSYAITAALELLLVGWVWFGIRLRRIKLGELLGGFSFRPKALLLDIGIAIVFWFAALFVLGSLGVVWAGFEHAVHHQPTPAPRAKGQPITTDPSQQQALRALSALAPDGPREIAAWALLCLLVGFCEELVFRGYLQRQMIALARGRLAVGVLLTSAAFGAAHAYQGARNMIMLAVFGVLFSVLALYRRALRPGMMAHSWHDLCAGLAIALLRSMHLI